MPEGDGPLQLLSCPQGHFWEEPAGPDGNGSAHACPVCGAVPDTLPLFDLAPTAPPPPPPTAVKPATTPPRDESGHPVIAGYEVQEALGKGPTGVAHFLARQVAVNRVVLLKVVWAKEDPGQLAWGSLRGEAAALGKLTHPNIVEVYEAGERDRQLFFNAIEFVDGPTLVRKVRDKPLPVQQAVRLVEALARAVQHAHDQGIVHRNLKPASVVLRRIPEPEDQPDPEDPGSSTYCRVRAMLYQPKITDFGLARRPVEGDVNDLELQGGIPGYLAPEQAWGRAKEIGPATDVYALGAILYELLAGRPPFRGATESETLDAIQCKEAAPPSRWRKVPVDLDVICRKCLAKQPRRRYASARDLAEDLRRFAEGLPIQAHAAGAGARFGKWLRRKPGVTSLLLLLLIGCIASLAMCAVLMGRALDAESELRLAKRVAQETRRELDETRAGLAELEGRARQAAYRWAFRQALIARNAGKALDARNLLDQCDPDERGWEWYYLRQQLDRRDPLRLTGMTQTVRSVAFSPDDRYVAAGGGDGDTGEIRVFHADSRNLAFRMEGMPGPVQQLAFVPHGDLLGQGDALAAVCKAGDRGGEVRTWSLDRPGARLSNQRVLDGSPATGLVSNGVGGLVVAQANGTMHRLDVLLLGVEDPFYRGFGGGTATRLAASSAKDWLAAARQDGNEVLVWTERDRTIPPQRLAGNAQDLAFNPESQRLALAGRDGLIRIWDVGAGREAMTLRGHTGAVKRLVFTHDGRRLASGGADGMVRIWDGITGELLLAFTGFGTDATDLAFSPDGRSLAIAVRKEVLIWGAIPTGPPMPAGMPGMPPGRW